MLGKVYGVNYYVSDHLVLAEEHNFSQVLVDLASNFLVGLDDVATFKLRNIELTLLKFLNDAVVLFNVVDEFLLYYVHFVYLLAPLVELFRQDIDYTIAPNVLLMFLQTLFAQEDIMFDAEVGAILLRMNTDNLCLLFFPWLLTLRYLKWVLLFSVTVVDLDGQFRLLNAWLTRDLML